MTTSNSANTKQSNNASQKRKPIHNGYFNHPTSSSSNIPMSILIREQGLEIYGLYWVMLEEAHAQLKCCVNIQTMGIIANIFHAQPEHLELLYHHYFRRPGKGYNSHILYADFCEESAIRSYFPHPLLAYTDNELLRMIMQDGLKAYGLYWLVMEKLYQQPQHFLAPQTASFIQNLYDVSDELMESVLYNYGLFYLDEKMNLHSKAIDDYREALDNMEDEKKRNTKPHVNNSLKANGNAEDFNTREMKKTSNIQKNPSPIINKEINKKNSSSEESGKEKEEANGLKVTDLNAVTPDMRPNAWEENLQEAMNDTSWYEVVAIQSGIPRLMMEEKEWFFNYLREQIILRGNESSMNSLHEIKNYFANLTRQGSHVSSTTQVALKKFLKNRQEQQQCSPYETITNGIRTYDGHPIPAYAKPRPSAAHIWNPVTNEWTR